MALDWQKANREQLIKRVEYLDETNRWYMFAVDMLTQMGDIYGDTTNIRNMHNILATTHAYIQRLFNFEIVAFYIINEEDAEFALQACHPESAVSGVESEINKLIEAGEFAWVLNQNKAVRFRVNDNSTLVLHVISSKTRLRGMFVGIGSVADEHKYTQGTLNLLSVVLHNTGYALESAALYDMIREQNLHLEETVERRTNELDHQCKHDSLTDLPNRNLFMDRLEHAIERAKRSEHLVAVMLFDLDMFKMINDTLGHQFGDDLLKQISTRLESLLITDYEKLCLRSDCDISLARFGGDEFAILMADVILMDDVIHIANEVGNAFLEPFIINEKEIFVTCSIGISLFPDDSDDTNNLIKLCDVAMYHAKQSGRNKYQFYSEKINNISSTYLHLGNKLHQALDNNEFELYYQPQICFKTGKVIGVEALIRWFSQGKMIPPDQFIPIAEDTGQILPIGEWVIETAANQAKRFKDQGRDLCVAVNLSAKQFMQVNLIDRLEEIINQVGISPKLIELEITEGTIIQDVDNTIQVLNEMHELGHMLSIDDFGTGYSSLCYLKKLPVDYLKIDKSFVLDLDTNTDDRAIVHSVVALAHSLNLEVVAEGVESQKHVDFLKKLNCEYGQGYLFSKPLPADKLTAFLDNFSQSK